MPSPCNVKDLKLYFGSIQFYNKFFPPNFSTTIESLNNLTRQYTNSYWDEKQKVAFQTKK